ncbi:hypothetical protein H5410_046685 [Solanum commersonii]|uniref:CCHC-type domain-containing protein n=1 Tax=Solanum commersonii TaxID=4109 RepID=A0A9J5XCY8_SOLCO|nr:hypothetical protein H5410_046685 [Solanum commersonii]
MLMYNTICKANKNSAKTIADMITTGFTDKILQAVKQEGEQNLTQNVVYTLVLNIIEYFSGRSSNNSETIITMLQNLRCKTLTSFGFYQDVFLSRVMELPECNSSHWKSKFINGLQALFAERVSKTLRGDSYSINYENYTYGKLIIKRHHLNERQHLGELCEQFASDIPKASSKDRKHISKNKSSKKDYKAWNKRRIEKKERRVEPYREKKRFYKSRQKFNKTDDCYNCGRFGHYAKDCRVKENIKNLDIDDNIKKSLSKIMLNSDLGESEIEYNSHEESSTS